MCMVAVNSEKDIIVVDNILPFIKKAVRIDMREYTEELTSTIKYVKPDTEVYGLKPQSYKHGFITHGTLGMDNIRRIFYQKCCRYLVDSGIHNREYLEPEDSSFSFFVKGDRDSCAKWHCDTHGSVGMFITAFPYTTQVLIGDSGYTEYYGSCDTQAHDDAINPRIEKGICSIFTPHLGDVVYLPPGSWHRANPKSTGYHLVLRTHILRYRTKKDIEIERKSIVRDAYRGLKERHVQPKHRKNESGIFRCGHARYSER